MMKRFFATLLVLSGVFAVRAETALVFGFDTSDSAADPNGIEYNGVKQPITFSGAASGVDLLGFDILNDIDAQVAFSIGAVGDLAFLRGTITPVGGAFYVGGYGGGIDGVDDSSVQFDTGEEAWVFTFSNNVILTAVDYYGPAEDVETLLTNTTAVVGSPFSADYTGSLYLNAGDKLTFGHSGTAGDYSLNDFSITVVPEPVSLALAGLGGLSLILGRRWFSC